MNRAETERGWGVAHIGLDWAGSGLEESRPARWPGEARARSTLTGAGSEQVDADEVTSLDAEEQEAEARRRHGT